MKNILKFIYLRINNLNIININLIVMRNYKVELYVQLVILMLLKVQILIVFIKYLRIKDLIQMKIKVLIMFKEKNDESDSYIGVCNFEDLQDRLI